MSAELIRKAVLAIMEDKIPLNSAWCTVKSVDATAKTCTVILDDDEDLKLEGILLGYTKSGLVIIPKNNSDVLVQFINNTKTVGYVICVQESLNAELMGNNFGGLMKSEIAKQKYQALENKFNQLISLLNGWLPVPNDGGASLKTLLTTWLATDFTLTTKAELENAAVKHGDG